MAEPCRIKLCGVPHPAPLYRVAPSEIGLKPISETSSMLLPARGTAYFIAFVTK